MDNAQYLIKQANTNLYVSTAPDSSMLTDTKDDAAHFTTAVQARIYRDTFLDTAALRGDYIVVTA